MSATNSFFIWFYYGLSGLGGWFIFLLLALIAVIWMLYDSASRRIPALGWRLGIILTSLLLLPAILFRFTVTDPASTVLSPLAPFSEPIFYLGILGGILPIVLAIGYLVTYQGMVGCPQGHVYEAVLGKCPYDEKPVVVGGGGAWTPPDDGRGKERGGGGAGGGAGWADSKPAAPAWLVTRDGHNHQLRQGVTTVGRLSSSDVRLLGDGTVGREHAKIIEQNGHFTLVDLGSKCGTRVNGKLVRGQVLLEPDDEVQFGENTAVRFVTTRR